VPRVAQLAHQRFELGREPLRAAPGAGSVDRIAAFEILADAIEQRRRRLAA
jgi:hypothetical protein